MMLTTKTSDQTRQRGDTLSKILVQFLLKPWESCASPPASLLFLDYLGWQLLNQPFIVYGTLFLLST